MHRHSQQATLRTPGQNRDEARRAERGLQPPRRVDAIHHGEQVAVGRVGERLAHGHPGRVEARDLDKFRRHELDDVARATVQTYGHDRHPAPPRPIHSGGRSPGRRGSPVEQSMKEESRDTLGVTANECKGGGGGYVPTCGTIHCIGATGEYGIFRIPSE
jgi:hypothetical protein